METTTMAVVTYAAPWISALFALVVAIGCILLGYWLGRNSSEKPMRSIHNLAHHDQGSKEDPGGDPFAEAMAYPEDEGDRKSTF